MDKAKRYIIMHRLDKVWAWQIAYSAQEACQLLGWLIGDCYVQEDRSYIQGL